MADLSEGSNVSGHSAARAEAGCVGTEWQQNTETLNTRSRREKVAAKSDIFTINQITVGPGGHSFLTTCSSPHTPLICHPAHTLWHLPHVKKQTSLDTLPPSSIYYKPHEHLNKDSSSPILSRYCKNLSNWKDRNTYSLNCCNNWTSHLRYLHSTILHTWLQRTSLHNWLLHIDGIKNQWSQFLSNRTF